MILAYWARTGNVQRFVLAQMSNPWLVQLSLEERGDDRKKENLLSLPLIKSLHSRDYDC